MRDVLRSLGRLVGHRARRAGSEVRKRFGSELCPYCFDYFSMASAPFRCSTPIRCRPEIDTILRDKWNDGSPKGKVIEVDGYVRSQICPECKNETKQRLCPSCHQDLPYTIGEFRNLVISVVGAKNAGKSHYLPVLIENLKEAIGPDLGFTITFLNDDTNRRYRADYYDPLFNQHRLLDFTRSGIADVRSRLPLVFRLTLYDVRADGQRRIKNLVTLAFFDTAGEDMNSRDTMAYVNKYIYRSDGIILLLDPLQLDYVRDRLKGTINLPGRDIETSDIVARLEQLIHIGTDLRSESQIDIPIAITLSKFDAVESLVDRGFEVVRNSNHVGGFDLRDFRNTDAEVQSLVDHWGGQYLLDQIKSGFSRHGFFAVTALGSVPQSDHVANIRPKRVADPFLWILHAQNLIKAKPESML